MKLINNDCIIAMKEMPDNSVDSIVTDPPYELGFMGKSWDSSGIAFNVEVWQEALRVLKPGGHLLAFSGSRTYHRMAVAIEDAGFEIRDQIMWVYGSGFPASHNVSKAIDKAAGAEREVAGTYSGATNVGKVTDGKLGYLPGIDYPKTDLTVFLTLPTTEKAQQWSGWGTALKPAHEPIVLARKPLQGTVANNVLTFGTGGLNIDGTRVVTNDNFDSLVGRPIQKLATRLTGESDEDYRLRVLESPEQQLALKKLKELGRFPANFIHDGSDEVLALFPITSSGELKPWINGSVASETSASFSQGLDGKLRDFTAPKSTGSAARFSYCAKASKRDRNEGLEGFAPKKQDESRKEGNVGGDNLRNRGVHERVNHHPTVKPTDLMRYLCRLITPPAGIVLDPFMGSGSTGKAAILEGFDFIGIEQSAEYLEIAKNRIEFVNTAIITPA
jgi:site-specific DNA-methyltransferase (adenine-specific)